MVLALKKRGIDPPKKLPELVSKFYQTVLQKKDSYEYNFDIEEDLNNFDPVITPMIVSAIVKFIKGLLEKKAKGETLTPEEQELAGAVEKDTKMLTTEASAQEGLTDDEGNKKGGTGMNFNKMLPIILVAVVVLFALKK